MIDLDLIAGPCRVPLVRVPAGDFVMGSADGPDLARPPRRVTVAAPFLLGRCPVTQGQWRAVRGDSPSTFAGGDDLPVEGVSWDDAVAFCAELARLSGRAVRLPSEAEWEYACRAGSAAPFFWGGDEEQADAFAWFDLNSGGRPHPVGGKRPNAWGLYDMAGNVWEWCADVWHGSYDGAPCDGSARADGADLQPRRSLRGGAWNFDAERLRSDYRSREWRQHRTDHFGLRVAVGL
jgi:formylglycine-generating enzyme required for sulfatase activity